MWPGDLRFADIFGRRSGFDEFGKLVDIPGNRIDVANVPSPPSGTAISRIDVIIRVERDSGT